MEAPRWARIYDLPAMDLAELLLYWECISAASGRSYAFAEISKLLSDDGEMGDLARGRFGDEIVKGKLQ